MMKHDLLKDAERRIVECRTAPAELRVVGPDGGPLAGARCEIALVKHEFKLGANAFNLGGIKDSGQQKAYEDRFAALLNFATLPFYWGGYEAKEGERNEARLDKMAAWCAAHEIVAKGHPLAWHEVFPQWAGALSDGEVLARLQARVRQIVERFEGRIDIWDVVNEATVSHRFENAVGRWMASAGAAQCVDEALSWAHEANPRATLLYNDFNISDDFEALVSYLVEKRAPVHTVGIQSHMHKDVWPLEKAWDACESYARFSMPLHYTELTVLSGRQKAPDDNDWHKLHDDWVSTPEGESKQLEYGSAFYTLLFSHPAVEAITWWDFADLSSWQGAPAGLVRKDMSAKPLYEWLSEAFHKRWSTSETVTLDADGRASFPCFFGEHEIRVSSDSGDRKTAAFSFRRKGLRKIEIAV